MRINANRLFRFALFGLVGLIITGCAKPRATVEVVPTAALFFERDASEPATQVGRSDWPSSGGPLVGPEFQTRYEQIYDWQGGGNWGFGGYGGGWNNYNRRVITYRVGSAVR